MVNSFVLTGLLLIAITGTLVSIVALHEALLVFRILKVLRLNGIREVIARGDVVDEVCRLCIFAAIMTSTILKLVDNLMVPWYINSTIACISLLVVAQSINRIFTRRRVIRIIELTEQTPRRRSGDSLV